MSKTKKQNAPKVEWHFGNPSHWTPCYDDDANKMEEAYQFTQGKGEATIQMNGGTDYVLDFDAMTQKNTESGKVRQLRRHDPAKKEKPNNKSGVGEDDDDDDPFSALPKKQKKVEKNGKSNSKAVKGKAAELMKDDDADEGAGNSEAKNDEEGGPGYQYGVGTAKGHAGAKIHGSSIKPGGDSSLAAGGGKLYIKGKGCVDGHAPEASTRHVIERGDVVYQCMLNQVEIGTNANKFYVIQALADDDPKSTKAYMFTRWGRVGSDGATQCGIYNSEDLAIKMFNKRFSEKTENKWDGPGGCAANHDNFNKKPGKYQLMHIDLGATAQAAQEDAAGATGAGGAAAAAALADAKSKKKEVEECTLPPAIRRVMELISNKKEMQRAMAELEIDTTKMPLGVISKGQLKKAYGILRDIEAELEGGSFATMKAKLTQHSSAFYTLIPHAFKVNVKPPVIEDVEMLKRKMDMLDMLSNIELAAKAMEEGESADGKGAASSSNNKIRHPLDSSFNSLHVKMDVLPNNSDIFKRVERYMSSTHAPTHTSYKLKCQAVLAVERPGEAERFQPYKKLERQMLWHGSRITNIYGILSTGLRIAPPEAPTTGFMFGKAVYHASSSSKSANYLKASHDKPEGFLFLCEVATGTPYELTEAKPIVKPPKGKDSTLGVGRYRTDMRDAVVDDEGIIWPMGPLKDTKQKSDLLYDEMMVYDVAQLRIRYVVQVKFEFV